MVKACDMPCVPWDSQQDYDSQYDADAVCSRCGVALREHDALWTRGVLVSRSPAQGLIDLTFPGGGITGSAPAAERDRDPKDSWFRGEVDRELVRAVCGPKQSVAEPTETEKAEALHLWNRIQNGSLHEFESGPPDDPDTCYAGRAQGYEDYGATCTRSRSEHEHPKATIAAALAAAREQGRRDAIAEALAQLDGIETWAAREDVPDLVALVRHLLAERDEARNERDALFRNRLRLETERDGAYAAAVRAAANEAALREEITTAFRRHGLAPGPEAIDGLVRERDAYKRAKAVAERGPMKQEESRD